MYEYRALVVSVYDADTLRADIDLGFGVWLKNQSVRWLRIDAWEMRGEEREAGLISRDVLREKILHKTIIITTCKDKKGKYGRYIGEILVEEEILNEGVTTSTLVNVNNWLVENGYAKYVEY